MKLKLEQLETFTISVPSRTDFRWLSLSRPLGEFVLIRIRAGGIEGWGEIVALRDWGSFDGRRHGETSSGVTAIVHEQFAPWLLENELELGELSARLDDLVVGNPYAKALVDIAVHDLVGKALGVPGLRPARWRCAHRRPGGAHDRLDARRRGASRGDHRDR